MLVQVTSPVIDGDGCDTHRFGEGVLDTLQQIQGWGQVFNGVLVVWGRDITGTKRGLG
ncbi:MAG: hypothetical protein H6661_05310 [Ardenticatenaceae bacterium]|nr:hypothetical protein [Ardenticatenaceae bacterium]